MNIFMFRKWQKQVYYQKNTQFALQIWLSWKDILKNSVLIGWDRMGIVKIVGNEKRKEWMKFLKWKESEDEQLTGRCIEARKN